MATIDDPREAAWNDIEGSRTTLRVRIGVAILIVIAVLVIVVPFTFALSADSDPVNCPDDAAPPTHAACFR